MQLTPGERLIAMMLADLMEHLKVDGEIDPAVVKRFLTSNDDWALAWKYQGLYGGEERSEADIRETGDILTMWRVIDNSVEGLSEAEKEGLDLSQFEFEGFDANNDPHYFIAHTMIEDLDRFEERKPPLNSHSMTSIARYRRMLPRFRAELDRTGARGSLTLDQLKAIVDYRPPSAA